MSWRIGLGCQDDLFDFCVPRDGTVRDAAAKYAFKRPVRVISADDTLLRQFLSAWKGEGADIEDIWTVRRLGNGVVEHPLNEEDVFAA